MATIFYQMRWVFFIQLLFCSNVNGRILGEHTFVYAYNANITAFADPVVNLQAIEGHVSVTPYLLGNDHILATDMDIPTRLLHFQGSFENHIGESMKTTFEAVAEFVNDGVLRQIYISERDELQTTEVNLVKGIISLFAIRSTFEPGIEVDSSGMCRVSYAAVENVHTDPDQVVVDKFKSACQPIQKPIDVWNYNLIPGASAENPEQMITRYWIDMKVGNILRATSHESLTFSPVPGTDVNVLKLTSWQDVIMVNSVVNAIVLNWESDTPLKTSEIAKTLTHSSNTVMHLAPGFPLDPTQHQCSLNIHLYITHPKNDDNVILLVILQGAIESARNALHAHQFESVEALHQILQLIRLLRCLPNRSDAVNILIQASVLSPPAIEAQLIYRQIDSWRERLVDVFIGCGTPLCTEVVLKRLEALTEVATVHQQQDGGLSREEELSRKMLFSKLWPSLSHLRQPTNEIFGRMLALCQMVLIPTDQSVCLITLSNLWSHVTNKDRLTREKMIDLVRNFLEQKSTVEEPLASQTNLEQFVYLTNSNIMAGLVMAVKLEATELADQIMRIGMDPSTTFPAIQAAAFHAVALLFRAPPNDLKQFTNRYSIFQKDHINGVLTEQLLKAPLESTYDILIGRELFHALLTLDMTTEQLTHIYRQLARQKRWPLVCACRQLMRQMCIAELLPLPLCHCVGESTTQNTHASHLCKIGAASGWAGLACDNSLQATFIHADLFNINDSMIVEYTMQLVHGPGGELKKSHLLVSLLNANGESKLLEFNINAYGLNSFLGDQGVPTGVYKPPMVDGAWLNLALDYFDTSVSPWTIFFGGMSELLRVFWSAPSEPTPVMQVIRPIIDERQYSVFSAGWVVVIDALGLISLEVTGALETRWWSQSGRTLVRTRLGLTSEWYIHVYGDPTVFSETEPVIVRGVGGEGELDFVSHVKSKELPDGICMSMNRGNDIRLLAWSAVHPKSEFGLLNKFRYRELTNKVDYDLLYDIQLPGVSYDLGRNNTFRCNQMKTRNLW